MNVPQLFQTMPCRVSGYQAALDGLNISETYLVAFNDICNSGKDILSPAAHSDYVGSYIYIPFFSKLFNLNIEITTILFYSLYGIICILISLVGLFKFYNSNISKIYGATFIVSIGLLCIFISDTYCFYGLTSLALITWWTKLKELEKINYKKLILLTLITGLIISFSNTVRGNSGNDVLLSILILLIFNTYKNKKFLGLWSICLIVIPIFLINLQIKRVEIKAKNYLIKVKDIEKIYDLNFNRALWHNAYYGLGYLSIDNQDVPIPTDTYAVEKARKVNPKVIIYSDEYEKILKNEFIKFVKKNPFLFIQITASKAGMVLLYFLIFFNIGIYYLFKNKVRFETTIFFVPGIILNFLFGIAAEPHYVYLLGMFAYSGLFTTKIIEDYYS
tara:strand:- start:118 stop:1284 length:1167 start_codon:yes stop_codon:yes gene_type:complete